METKEVQVVIFSSGSQRNTIIKLSEELERKNCKCMLWTNLFTRQDDNSKFALLPTLLKKIPTFDFAIILATPDDSVNRIRNGVEENFQCMRDNVIFEIRPENFQSRKVAEKCGAVVTGEFVKNVRGKNMKHSIYSINSEIFKKL